MDEKQNEQKLRSILAALKDGPLAATLERIIANKGLPGLTLITGQAYAGKSTLIRGQLEELGVAPGRASSLETTYAFKTDDGVKFGFVLGGEPEYKATLPEVIGKIDALIKDGCLVVWVDSLRLLPLYKMVKEEAISNDQRSNNDHSTVVGGYRFTATDAIWSGGITTNSILSFDTLHHGYLARENGEAYVLAAFNPLLSDSPQYKQLLEGSLAGIETISVDGAVKYTGRSDIAVPSQGSLRTSDSWSGRIPLNTPDALELTGEEEDSSNG